MEVEQRARRRRPYPLLRTKAFSDVCEKISGKGASASEAHRCPYPRRSINTASAASAASDREREREREREPQSERATEPTCRRRPWTRRPSLLAHALARPAG